MIVETCTLSICSKYNLVYIASENIALFREEATSALAGFHAGPISWSNWNLEMLVFVSWFLSVELW